VLQPRSQARTTGPHIVLVTGAGSGSGALTARTLAHASHLRPVIDPVDDGAAEVLDVAERTPTGFAERIGIADLLPPGVG